jgi:hypothetical protein
VILVKDGEGGWARVSFELAWKCSDIVPGMFDYLGLPHFVNMVRLISLITSSWRT